VTYPETAVAEIVNRSIPVQIDNSKPENEATLKR